MVAIEQNESVIARADDYASLIAGLVTRRHELGLPQRAVDDLSGYADGYTAKIEAHLKTAGRISLSCLLKALGVELVLIRTVPHHMRHGRLFRSGSAATRIRHDA